MIVPFEKKSILRDPKDIDPKGDVMVKFIRPIPHTFDSVTHFKSTMGAAIENEHLEQRKILHFQQTDGRVTAAEFIEVIQREDKEEVEKWAVVFSVTKTKLWNNEGCSKMRGISFKTWVIFLYF